MEIVFSLTSKVFATIRAAFFVSRALSNIVVVAWKRGQHINMAKKTKKSQKNKQKMTTEREANHPQVDNTSASKDKEPQTTHTTADPGKPYCGNSIKITQNSVWVPKGKATTSQSKSPDPINPSVEYKNTASNGFDSMSPSAAEAKKGSSTKTMTHSTDSSFGCWTTTAAVPVTPHSSKKRTISHKENDSCTKEVTPSKSSPRPLEARVPFEELQAGNMPPTTPPDETVHALLHTTAEQVKPSVLAGDPKPASATPPATNDEARKPLEEAGNVPTIISPNEIKVPTPPIGETPEQVKPSYQADKPKPADAAPRPQPVGREDAYKRVLHISKVPLHWTVYDLSVVFSTWYPKVVNIKLLYDQSTRMSKGCGFVTFINSEEATNAVNQIIRGEWKFGFLCNHPEGGLRVSFALPETRSAPYKVWVCNLRAYARRDDLREHFAACEGFHDAQVLSDINVGSPAFSVPRGHGFVRKAGYRPYGFAYFTTLEAARQAIKTMNNSALLDQAIRVDWPRSKQMDAEFRKTVPELRDQPIPLRQPTPLWTPPMQGENPTPPEAYMPAPYRQPTPAPFTQPAPVPASPVQPFHIPVCNTNNGTDWPRIINRVAVNERTNVYLGNISPEIPERDVRAMLEAFGPVKQLQVFGDRRFAFAHFYHHQAAAAAVLLLNKRPVGGQTLRVSWSGRQGY